MASFISTIHIRKKTHCFFIIMNSRSQLETQVTRNVSQSDTFKLIKQAQTWYFSALPYLHCELVWMFAQTVSCCCASCTSPNYQNLLWHLPSLFKDIKSVFGVYLFQAIKSDFWKWHIVKTWMKKCIAWRIMFVKYTTAQTYHFWMIYLLPYLLT